MNNVCVLKIIFCVLPLLVAFKLSLQANIVCMCVTTPVTFLKVIDGDTIWVKKEGEKILVQFHKRLLLFVI